MQAAIKDFIEAHTILSICFVDKESKPYCINCFYYFDEENLVLSFKSSYGTTHDSLTLPGAFVSGTILPEKIDVLKIKGVQFSGTIIEKKDVERLKLNSKYTKKYPFSLTLPGYIWAIQLEQVKFTNNTLGFGNKTIWKRAEK